jgi:hypothetical protein
MATIRRDPAPIGWFLDEHAWRLLLQVKSQLYGDGRHLTPDHRRDLANLLEGVTFNAIPLSEDEISEKA